MLDQKQQNSFPDWGAVTLNTVFMRDYGNSMLGVMNTNKQRSY